MIKSLYINVLASDRNNGDYSEYFECPIGEGEAIQWHDFHAFSLVGQK